MTGPARRRRAGTARLRLLQGARQHPTAGYSDDLERRRLQARRELAEANAWADAGLRGEVDLEVAIVAVAQLGRRLERDLVTAGGLS